jgi:hypothetical protein
MDMPTEPLTTPLQTATIDLDPGEYFANISGTSFTDTYAGSLFPVGVASLRFSTNKRDYGPFGNPTTGKPFGVQRRVAAFHGAVYRGTTTEILTAIGFWTVPVGKQPLTGQTWTRND